MKASVGHHKKSGFASSRMIRIYYIRWYKFNIASLEAANAPVNFILSEILAGHDAPPHQKSQPDPGPEYPKSLIQEWFKYIISIISKWQTLRGLERIWPNLKYDCVVSTALHTQAMGTYSHWSCLVHHTTAGPKTIQNTSHPRISTGMVWLA